MSSITASDQYTLAEWCSSFLSKRKRHAVQRKRDCDTHMIVLRDIIILSISTAGLENYVFKVRLEKKKSVQGLKPRMKRMMGKK